MFLYSILIIVSVCLSQVFGGPVASNNELEWDFAVAADNNEIKIYNNGDVKHTAIGGFNEIKEMTHDPVTNLLLFVGSRAGDSATVFSYDIATDTFNPMGSTATGINNIKSLAYDPVKGKLFWIDSADNSICWTAIEQGKIKSQTKNILAKKPGLEPVSIAIDSCGGYVYYSNAKGSVERIRYDGTDSELLMNTDKQPYSVMLDQRTKKIYWFEDGYDLMSADFDGSNKKTLRTVWEHSTNKLTISKDYIFLQDDTCDVIYRLSKEGSIPEVVISVRVIHSSAANYKIKDQTEGHSDCAVLTKLVEPKPTCVNCVHGEEVNGSCVCTPGFVGERCDVSVCHNYCFSGDCTVSQNGQPLCNCSHGYHGPRCEISVCENYCMNNGICSFNANDQPVCNCSYEYDGPRCEVSVCEHYCMNNGICSFDANDQPMCNCSREYDGPRCEVSVCEHYCMNNGICSFDANDQPMCNCSREYDGPRCEKSVCENYCMNNGICSFNATDQPMCNCSQEYHGARCEISACENYCMNNGICSFNVTSGPLCQCDNYHEGTRCETFAYCQCCGKHGHNASSCQGNCAKKEPNTFLVEFYE